uniref:alpha-N-acetylgalactosaminide alpha-2,6-sialyltransferase n=1 Tax=Poecilia formosa TaxID=48698 RepID=A0A096M6L5_POEFO
DLQLNIREEAEAPPSLRAVMRNDPVLQSRFSFSLPVLQWAGSWSRSSWTQLKDRAPPYSWKGLPVSVTPLVIFLLISKTNASQAPSCKQMLLTDSPGRCVRCAVVGNGGILRGAGQGRNIDGHDLVFRMNGAVIWGFEEDVGTKVSFYGFTTNTLSWYRPDGFAGVPQGPDIKFIFIPSETRCWRRRGRLGQNETESSGLDKVLYKPWKYFGHKPPESFRMLHPQFISYLMHSLLTSPLMTDSLARDLYMPSTMLLTALHTCDQVSAYGFITRNYADFSDHYYDSVPRPLRFFANHDLQMEGGLWEALHRRGVLRLFQRGRGRG